jgi:hypothetical protein
MLTVSINSYEEYTDHFDCTAIDSEQIGNLVLPMKISATLMRYIAPDLIDQCEDLPFDMCGKVFTIT